MEMARRSNFLDADSGLMEQSLRFVRNDMEDNINQYFGGGGGGGGVGGAGGERNFPRDSGYDNQNAATAPQRDFKVVKPRPGNFVNNRNNYGAGSGGGSGGGGGGSGGGGSGAYNEVNNDENRRKFIQQLGILNAAEAMRYAGFQFDLPYFRRKQLELRRRKVKEIDIDEEIIREIESDMKSRGGSEHPHGRDRCAPSYSDYSDYSATSNSYAPPPYRQNVRDYFPNRDRSRSPQQDWRSQYQQQQQQQQQQRHQHEQQQQQQHQHQQQQQQQQQQQHLHQQQQHQQQQQNYDDYANWQSTNGSRESTNTYQTYSHGSQSNHMHGRRYERTRTPSASYQYRGDDEGYARSADQQREHNNPSLYSRRQPDEDLWRQSHAQDRYADRPQRGISSSDYSAGRSSNQARRSQADTRLHMDEARGRTYQQQHQHQHQPSQHQPSQPRYQQQNSNPVHQNAPNARNGRNGRNANREESTKQPIQPKQPLLPSPTSTTRISNAPEKFSSTMKTPVAPITFGNRTWHRNSTTNRYQPPEPVPRVLTALDKERIRNARRRKQAKNEKMFDPTKFNRSPNAIKFWHKFFKKYGWLEKRVATVDPNDPDVQRMFKFNWDNAIPEAKRTKMARQRLKSAYKCLKDRMNILRRKFLMASSFGVVMNSIIIIDPELQKYLPPRSQRLYNTIAARIETEGLEVFYRDFIVKFALRYRKQEQQLVADGAGDGAADGDGDGDADGGAVVPKCIQFKTNQYLLKITFQQLRAIADKQIKNYTPTENDNVDNNDENNSDDEQEQEADANADADADEDVRDDNENEHKDDNDDDDDDDDDDDQFEREHQHPPLVTECDDTDEEDSDH